MFSEKMGKNFTDSEEKDQKEEQTPLA